MIIAPQWQANLPLAGVVIGLAGATELSRVDGLRPRLEQARSLHRDLETRARELRTSWLLHQAENPLTR